MRNAIATIATAAAMLLLTSCGDDPETVAEIGCEDLVQKHLESPDGLSFDHDDASKDGDRWAIDGTATWDEKGESMSADYACRITVDGKDWEGRVSMVAP